MPQDINSWADRRRALDPSIYKPKYYIVDITCGTAIGDVGKGSALIDNSPFIMDVVTHSLVGRLPDDQDGQYAVLWRDDQTVYSNLPGVANAMFGNVYQGRPIPLPIRTFYKGSKTLSVDLVNLLDRTALGLTFKIQMVFVGFEQWQPGRAQ